MILMIGTYILNCPHCLYCLLLVFLFSISDVLYFWCFPNLFDFVHFSCVFLFSCIVVHWDLSSTVHNNNIKVLIFDFVNKSVGSKFSLNHHIKSHVCHRVLFLSTYHFLFKYKHPNHQTNEQTDITFGRSNCKYNRFYKFLFFF